MLERRVLSPSRRVMGCGLRYVSMPSPLTSRIFGKECDPLVTSSTMFHRVKDPDAPEHQETA